MSSLVEAGRALQLAHFGLYALDSLRLEKCYRSWKADLTTEYSPLAASLARFVRLDKPADFIGKDALRREAAAGPRERLVPLVVDAVDADAAPVSIVYQDAETVGLVTSGGYGYRLALQSRARLRARRPRRRRHRARGRDPGRAPSGGGGARAAVRSAEPAPARLSPFRARTVPAPRRGRADRTPRLTPEASITIASMSPFHPWLTNV